MKKFKRSKKPEFQHACIVPLCPAGVAREGQRCVVHRTWTNGPHDVACCRCRQPIVHGDLWRLLDASDPASAVHAPCVADRAKPPKVERKTWAQGSGALGL
ncbi:MAG: hypothetical protein IT348_05825 [Candidatus Eisenbacteria bacterium]|nr:hypothetical protein [Candidatus Eisenbacteria bacterium]